MYSSLPLQGASKNQAQAITNGMKLALDQAGGKVGDYTIKYVSLDDSTAQAGAWTPEAASANARKAAQDDCTIAYLGEFNSGGSAVSLPILNEAGVPQNGLTNTAVGLTSDAPGSEPGEPDKYYPSGDRHYVRIVPKDDIQGAALVTMMKQDGCENVFMTNDKEVFGAGLARNIELIAKEQGLRRDRQRGDRQERRQLSLAGRRARAARAPTAWSTPASPPTTRSSCSRTSRPRCPTASSTVPTASPSRASRTPRRAASPPMSRSKVKVSIAVLPPEKYPAEGQRFFKDYAAAYDDASPDAYAIYGYEAMGLTLDAIKRAAAKGKVDKAAVAEQLFATKDRTSALGTYSIDENGDTTLTDYGSYADRGRRSSCSTRRSRPRPADRDDANTSPSSGSGAWAAAWPSGCWTAGHAVTLYDPNAEAVAALVEHGGRAASSPAEAARGAAFVLCSVPNPAILREAIAGDGGVLEGAEPGALIIDFSTGDPAVARELAGAAAERGVGFLDAPVSRGVVGAENGTLAVMVGGEPEALETRAPGPRPRSRPTSCTSAASARAR